MEGSNTLLIRKLPDPGASNPCRYVAFLLIARRLIRSRRQSFLNLFAPRAMYPQNVANFVPVNDGRVYISSSDLRPLRTY